MYIIFNIRIFVYLLWGGYIIYLDLKNLFLKMIPNIMVEDKSTSSLYEIMPNSERVQIHYDKYNKLGKKMLY